MMSCKYKVFMGVIANCIVSFQLIKTYYFLLMQRMPWTHLHFTIPCVTCQTPSQKSLFMVGLKECTRKCPSFSNNNNSLTSGYTIINRESNQERLHRLLNEYLDTKWVSLQIPILAGVQQGCPLSHIIFNLCIKVNICATASIGASIAAFWYTRMISF